MLTVSADKITADSTSLELSESTTFVVLLTSIYFIFALIGVLNHEMWGDELYAWLLARDSSSIVELVKNVRYERHPSLWYLCLRLITRFTHNPAAMQIFHVMLATGVVFLFAKFAPFSKLQKVLFSFGYFAFYEYAVISRNYVLGVLLVFCFCTLYVKTKKNYLALSLTLALLANTNAYSLILAIAMWLTLVLSYFIGVRTAPASRHTRRVFILGQLIIILSIVAAVIQFLPPADYYFAPPRWDKNSSTQFYFIMAITKVWASYFPLPDVFNFHFWNTNILMSVSDNFYRRAGAPLSLLLLALSTAFLIRKPTVLFLYLCGTFGILFFHFSVTLGYIRHSGHLFILFIACLWLAEYYRKSERINSKIVRAPEYLAAYRKKFLTLILCIHFLAGIFAMCMDLLHPFSPVKSTAEFINKQKLSDLLIVGSVDYEVSPLTAYINREIYQPQSSKFGTFHVMKYGRENKSDEEVIDQIIELLKSTGQDVLLVSGRPIKANTPRLCISELWRFNKKTITGEGHFLYLVRKGEDICA